MIRPPGGAAALALTPLSWLYGGAVRLRGALYDAGALSCRRLPAPVLSVGNLTVGGTGKTPLVIRLTRLLLEQGRRPAILLRGYGGANARRPGRPALVVSRGDGGTVADAGAAGDEAVLLARDLPQVPVVACPDRYRGGCAALEAGSVDLLILDDGFQHRGLHRDADVVALDAADPFAGGRLLPAGLLREPVRGLRRAHAAVLTRCDDEAVAAAAAAGISRIAPGLPVFRARHRPRGLRWADGREEPCPQLSELSGRPVAAFAGLARPQVLAGTLEALGALLTGFTPLPDHHPFGPGRIEGLMADGRRSGAEWMITTAKDAVRLPPGTAPRDLLVLEVGVEIEGESRLLQQLLSLCIPGLPAAVEAAP